MHHAICKSDIVSHSIELYMIINHEFDVNVNSFRQVIGLTLFNRTHCKENVSGTVAPTCSSPLCRYISTITLTNTNITSNVNVLLITITNETLKWPC